VLAMLGVLPLLALGFIAFKNVGSGFMPAMDEGGFIIDYLSPPGTALSETDRLVCQVEAILAATPEVATWSRRTGASLGGDLAEPNKGDFFVRLKSGPRRPIDEIMAEVRVKITQDVPGLGIEMAQLMEDLLGDLTSVPQPIEVKLFTDARKAYWTRPAGLPPGLPRSRAWSMFAMALIRPATPSTSRSTKSRPGSRASTQPKRPGWSTTTSMAKSQPKSRRK
jgi:hypothetical protein